MTSHSIPMQRALSRLMVGMALLAAVHVQAMAADVAVPAPVTKPSADKILRKMSDNLADAKQFSFKGTRTIGASLAASKTLQATSEIEVTVARPNRVVGISTNAAGVRKFYFDGLHFTLLDAKENTYGVVPLQVTLDELPAQLATTYGFLPPLADFVMSNPYRDLKHRSKSVTYVGTDTVGMPPIKVHRIKLAGTLADAELWIGVDDHLPRKMTASVKGGADVGTALTIEFNNWNLKPGVTGQTFTFVPPKDSLQIPMITTAAMQAARESK